jgi:hypothetical protein
MREKASCRACQHFNSSIPPALLNPILSLHQTNMHARHWLALICGNLPLSWVGETPDTLACSLLACSCWCSLKCEPLTPGNLSFHHTNQTLDKMASMAIALLHFAPPEHDTGHRRGNDRKKGRGDRHAHRETWSLDSKGVRFSRSVVRAKKWACPCNSAISPYVMVADLMLRGSLRCTCRLAKSPATKNLRTPTWALRRWPTEATDSTSRHTS